MWQELTSLWHSLKDAEYAHLVMEPLPMYGIGIGALFLILAILTGESKSRMLALVLICACSASVWPYLDLRKEAAPRILATHEPSYGPLIREQTTRREGYAWAFYVLAGISAVTLLAAGGSKGKPFLLMTAAAALVVFVLSLWLHKKECEIYHRNIVKYRPPKP